MKFAPNLILVGPMGSGKTSLGKRLAQRLGMIFVDADREIERSTGANIPLIFELEGEAGFRLREHEVLQQLCAGAGRVIATGGGAVLHPDTGPLLSRRGFVVYLQVDARTQLERLRHDRSRPLLQREDRAEALQRLSQEREPLYQCVADLRHDTSHGSLKHGVEQLVAALDLHWRRTDTGTLDPPA